MGVMVPVGSRIVPHFSCGAASAVATKLALAQFRSTHEVVIVNAFIEQEHSDNRRFLADCERWFDHPVIVLRDEKYGASTYEVWRRERYTKGRNGAPCSRALKRRVLDAFSRPGDVAVLGYTSEEEERFADFQEHFPNMLVLAPLIEHQLSKADCLAMVERAGITLPAMYRLGYNNANCIGCVKGGKGYWNKIRRDFPEAFEAVAQIEESIGPGAYLFYDSATRTRFSLRQLPSDAGHINPDEPEISCSFFCELAERKWRKSTGEHD